MKYRDRIATSIATPSRHGSRQAFIAPRGPDDIFTSTQIDELIALLDHITATAVAA